MVDAIYTRQSVDKVDSISIESQLEFCKYETRGGEFEYYRDKGYSGKNTDRPDFQRMMKDIKAGKIKRVIVYKLDRISRSILDFASMMEEFGRYGVEFVSCTEKFDTSSPMGRAMLNICIVFAQLERETIQMRVTDAYLSRSKHGFYMGGKIPYGFRLVPFTIGGKKTAMYEAVPEEAMVTRLVCEMYADPNTSFGDIMRYLHDNGIRNRDGLSWDRNRLAEMVKNPIYVMADLAVYEFFKDQGANIVNDPSDFIGTNGCYLYTGRGAGRKQLTLEGQTVVLAPHEGIVPSDIWLAARKKCMNNKQVAKPVKAKNSWLVGLAKCGKCGYALCIKKSPTKTGRYFICSRHLTSVGCDGVGGISAPALEEFVFDAMKDRLASFDTLSAQTEHKENPKLTELRIQEKQIDAEIDSLMERLLQANDTLMDYINRRINELDSHKKSVQDSIRELSVSTTPTDVKAISNYLSVWDELSMEDKHMVASLLIYKVKATQTSIEIVWRI